eukprot:sb/3463215/
MSYGDLEDVRMESALTDFTSQNYRTIVQNVDEQEDSRARKLQRIKRRGFYNVDECMEYIGMGKYHWLWMGLFGISSMAQAVEITLSSLILSDLGCYWNLTVWEEVLIPCLVMLCSIPGDLVGGRLADTYGRFPVLVAGQVIIAVFGVLSAFAPTYIWYLILRCVVGFGFGMIVFLIIVQVAELCPTAYRATAVSITFIMWTFGNIYIILGAWWLEEDYGWRAVVLWAAIPCVIMLFIIPFADESPKYCIISGDPEKAKAILTKIAHFNKIEMCPGELESYVETRRGRLADIFAPNFRQVTFALIVAMFAANFMYYGAIYAAPLLLQYNYCNGDFAEEDSCLLTDEEFVFDLIIGCGEFLSIPIFAFSSELLGRVRAANVVSACLLVFVILLEFCFGQLVLITELFFERALANAVLLLIYIYTPEFYPTYIRSIAFGFIMTFSAWGGILAIINVYVVGLYTEWAFMWYIFGAMAIILLTATFFFGRETLGQRLEDNRPETVMSMRSSRASNGEGGAGTAGKKNEGDLPGTPVGEQQNSRTGTPEQENSSPARSTPLVEQPGTSSATPPVPQPASTATPPFDQRVMSPLQDQEVLSAMPR